MWLQLMTLSWVDHPGPDLITQVLQSTEPFPAEDRVKRSKTGNVAAFEAGGGRPRAKMCRHFQKVKRQGSTFLSRRECSPANTLIFTHWDLCLISDLQNCTIINFCCFSPQLYDNLLWQLQKTNPGLFWFNNFPLFYCHYHRLIPLLRLLPPAGTRAHSSGAHPPWLGMEGGSHVFPSQHAPAEVALSQCVTTLSSHSPQKTNSWIGWLTARSSKFLISKSTLPFNLHSQCWS